MRHDCAIGKCRRKRRESRTARRILDRIDLGQRIVTIEDDSTLIHMWMALSDSDVNRATASAPLSIVDSILLAGISGAGWSRGCRDGVGGSAQDVPGLNGREPN